MKKSLLLLIILSIASLSSHGQGSIKKYKALLRDSLDGAFDFSDFLIYAPSGFIPVPSLITEPALGGFGFVIAPIFIKKRPATYDTIGSKLRRVNIPPDITGGALMYSANNSYALMAFRSGTWVKKRIKYRVGGGYANINLNFYRTAPGGTEIRSGFNFKVFPLFVAALKQIRGTRWSAGVQYTYLHTELEPTGGNLPSFVTDKEIKGIQSMPGLIVEFDGRDNTFTPNKGLKIHANYGWSKPAFGSDFDYESLAANAYFYQPISKTLVGGLRYEMKQAFGSPPFYLLPYLDLRGVPIARYQGNIFSVFETEFRWDFVQRWSLVGFAGSGKVYDQWSDFNSSKWISSGGGGFRYLMARKFKLRMGMDLARGPEQWAYYVVFGSSWR